MLAIKSNLKTFKILEGNLDNFRKKIDQINRIVLPKSLLKKKKAVEEEKQPVKMFLFSINKIKNVRIFKQNITIK